MKKTVMSASSRLVQERLFFCDFLRGIAALTVMFAHFIFGFEALGGWFHNPKIMEGYYPSWFDYIRLLDGAFGVGLFFLISGYVIPLSLQNRTWKTFLIARAIRLYPTFFACTAVTIIFLVVFDRVDLNFNYLFISLGSLTFFGDWFGFPPFDAIIWTLEVEAKFYLFSALVISFLGLKKIAIFLPLIICILLYSLGFEPKRNYAGFSFDVLLANFSYIAFMQVGYVFFLYHRQFILVKEFLLILILSLCSALVLVYQVYGHFIVSAYYFAAFILFCICFFMREWHGWSKLPMFFSNISYPLYAVHSTVGYVLLSYFNFELDLGWAVSLLLVVCVVFFIAYMVHHVVEKPSVRYSSFYSKKLTVALRNG